MNKEIDKLIHLGAMWHIIKAEIELGLSISTIDGEIEAYEKTLLRMGVLEDRFRGDN